MKTAFTAEELGLGLTIAPVDVTTSVASLAGLSRVNGHHLAAESLGLVFKEAPQLAEAPGVKSATGFPMIDLNPVSDVREVFKHDSSPWLNIPDNRTGDNVVAIPSESLFTTSEASKVSFSTLRPIGLQVTSKAKHSLDNFLHMFVAMKTVIRTNSRSGHSQIHTDSFPVGDKLNVWQVNNYMKVKPIFAVNKVSRSSRTADCIFGVLRECENNLCSALSGGKIHDAPLPIQREGMQVVTGWAKHRLGTSCFQPLLLSGNRRLHRFGSFLSGLNVKVRDEIREGYLAITIRQTVKAIGIAVVLFPSSTANGIKRLGELLHRFMQSVSLFFRRLEQYPYRSIHIQIIPYSNQILQYKEVKRLWRLKQRLLEGHFYSWVFPL